MKSTIAIAALVAGANALVGRSDSCCFQIAASGGESGSLGQLTDGQVRLGDTTLSAAEFCISNSIITDSEGRGCVITSESICSPKLKKSSSTNKKSSAETTQFQCDQGATGTSGFTISSSGLLSFDGSSSFIACQTGEDNGSNIYTTNSTSVTECVSVKLTGDSCAAAASSSVASSVAAASPAPSSSSVSSSPYTVIQSSIPAVPVTTVTPTSRPLIPTSSAVISTPVAASTSATQITSYTSTATASTSTSTSTSSTSSTASAAASSTAATSGAATSAPMGFAHWVASVAVMLSVMVLY
ncbi:hypothetical protein N7466_010699 [Penicillium verhagenii]|uniref:uncharacterized protein n=1 Tax=Penicillium verhagenii TaxID=1562060 RepID=UPI0025458997|nr:uncharacterized protein N7466_010699 [Penicillium verhagenii]KAJ5917145.1 hypothetical protein N7466_010699 [Penicillium verhagenii]